MGYVIERTSAGGKARYTAMYRDIRGSLKSAGTFATGNQANRAWERAEDHVAAGRIGDPRRGKQTLRRYIEAEWFPRHVIEASTRQSYAYVIDRYILPELGDMKMAALLPGDVRRFVLRLQEVHGVNPPTIRCCKVILDAVFTTALNDQIIALHPGRGVKTPPIPKKPRRILTAEQFDRLYTAVDDDTMRLLVETDIETGLRWGELTELRVSDFDDVTGTLTIARAVVELAGRHRPDGARFVVKQYPKDKEWRRIAIAPHLVAKLCDHISAYRLGSDGLLFPSPTATTRRHRRPEQLPDPVTLGLTEPNGNGRRYRHGTTTAYQAGRCRCQHCRDALATYRAARRAKGKDRPRSPGPAATDGDRHLSNRWFRQNIWTKALASADLGFKITPHGLRHSHASWLLAGGADLQVVKERLGHGSITTTEQYLHTLPGADRTALNALDAVRSRRELP